MAQHTQHSQMIIDQKQMLIELAGVMACMGCFVVQFGTMDYLLADATQNMTWLWLLTLDLVITSGFLWLSIFALQHNRKRVKKVSGELLSFIVLHTHFIILYVLL